MEIAGIGVRGVSNSGVGIGDVGKIGIHDSGVDEGGAGNRDADKQRR